MEKKMKLNFVIIFTRHFLETYYKTWISDEEVFVYWTDSEVFYDFIVNSLLNLILSYLALTTSHRKVIRINVARGTDCINFCSFYLWYFMR